jgi:pimeloyl-ACP methyl ester carboxylesterase
MLNGTGSPMSQWDPVLLAALSRTQRVLVYDYPGLGGSGPLPRQARDGTITFDGLARHAAGLLAALRLGTADVLGWSMGGFVAQRLVVQHPSRVRRLVLAGTNPGGRRAVLGPAWVQAQDSDPDGSLRGYVRTNYPAGARDRGWAFIRRVNDAVADGRYPTDRVPTSTYDAMVGAEDPWLASGANLRQLPSVHQHTLVIAGAEDVVTPPANSRILADAIPHSRLRLVPGAGHSFLFQRPTSTAAVIADFLDR